MASRRVKRSMAGIEGDGLGPLHRSPCYCFALGAHMNQPVKRHHRYSYEEYLSPATGLATYPDITVICGPIIEDPKSKHVVLNPTLLVEVTSPSSEEWDRGKKLSHYLQIPSLAALLLVSHTSQQLELIVRLADGSCTRTMASAGETLEIPNMNVRLSLSVDDVYAGIEVR